MRHLPGFADGILAAQNDELENIQTCKARKDSGEKEDKKVMEEQEEQEDKEDAMKVDAEKVEDGKKEDDKKGDDKTPDDYLLYQLQRMMAHLTNSKEKFFFLNLFVLKKIFYLKLRMKNQHCHNKLIFLYLILFYFQY
jgi:hypothetical protein